jgi:dTDP-4-dehydrorhamnose reductase
MLLVTGASGLLGANLLLIASRLGHETAGITYRHVLRIPGVAVFSADLTDEAATRGLISELNPTIIIHCAAATNVDWCEENPQEAEKINVDASRWLAEMAAQLKAQFVYVSTDSVFDGERGNYREEDEPAPVNWYAQSKLLGERAVLGSNPTALVARVNIYGWNVQNKLSLAEWALERLRAGEVVPGFTDVFFSPILVNDLSEQLLAMLQAKLTGTYHVTGSERVSKYEFARRIAAAFGFDPAQVWPTQLSQAGLRARRPLDISLNTQKISAALGHAMPNVEAGLRRFRHLQDSGYVDEIKSYLGGTAQ